MVAELAELLNDFPGESNQTRCFLHILNLVVKSIIKQFDLPKAKSTALLDEATKELLELAGDLALEEAKSRDEEGKDDDEDDNEDGWVDERELMSEWEKEELDESVQPLRLLLTKVSRWLWLRVKGWIHQTPRTHPHWQALTLTLQAFILISWFWTPC
jgi:hypothetical protein